MTRSREHCKIAWKIRVYGAGLYFSSPCRNQYTSATFFGPHCRSDDLITQHDRPIDLSVRHNPWLFERSGAPLRPSWQCQHCRFVTFRHCSDRNGVGIEARHHRRIHGIGRPEGAKQERPALAPILAPTLAPILAPTLAPILAPILAPVLAEAFPAFGED